MLIQRVEPDQLRKEYNIMCQRLYPQRDVDTPFGSTWCEIEPGGATAPHDHHETETFFILRGAGRMRISGQESNVSGGDVVLIPPHSGHVLTNTSATETLVFLSVYWENPGRIWETAVPKRVLVFSAPPTPNGNMHVGHLSGPYLAADVYRRFMQLCGVEVKYVSGSDDHQSYVATKSRSMGISPAEVIERFATSIQGTLRRANAAPDHYLRAYGNPAYVEFVQGFYRKLRDAGKLEWREVDTPYCETCELYLYEAHLHGGCPVCGKATNGNGCEACGQTNDCGNLVEPTCNHCGTRAGTRRVYKDYFPLSQYAERLSRFLQQTALPPRMRRFAQDVLDKPLPDISVSHVAAWGIPAQSGQVLYDWFEMAAGYLFLGEGYWTDPHAQVVQAFGFDNSFFYLMLVPALWMAYDERIRMPAGFLINQFYLLDGLKFSTSRNHAVWGDEILEHVPADILRFYLAYSRPETEETNFTLREFAATIEAHLVKTWEPLLARADALFTDTLPRLSGDLTGHARALRTSLEDAVSEVGQLYTPAAFSLNQVARTLVALAERTGRFMDIEAPLLRDETVVLVAEAVATLGLLSYPIMPDFGTFVLERFDLTPTRWGLPSVHHVTGPLTTTRFSTGLQQLRAFIAKRV